MSKEKPSKENVLEESYNAAYEYEKKYFGCAQCVLAAIQDIFRLVNGGAFKGATGLSGGIGVMGSACGALTGGVIALGSKIGRERSNFEDLEEIRWKTYELARKLYIKFEQEYGSVNCRDIQKKILGRSYNLRDPEEYKEFEKAGGHAEKCPEVVGKAARWVAEILLEEQDLPAEVDV